MHSIHRLHMHWLPNWSALCIDGSNGFQNFRGARLPTLRTIQCLSVIPDLFAHGLPIDNKRRQPIVWFCPFHNGVHFHRQPFKAFSVAFIDCLFLGNMFFQIRILATYHTCNHIAHTIVIANFFVLVPCRILSGLGTPFTSLIGILQRICQQAPARGTGNDFVAVIGNCGIIAKAPTLVSVDRSSHSFRCVFNKQRTVLFADVPDHIDLSRKAVKMRHDNQLYVWVKVKRFFQCGRIHIP